MITSIFVPCGKDTIYQMLNNKKNGKAILNRDWSGLGKSRIIDDSTMTEIIVNLHKESGRTFGTEDTKEMKMRH